MARISQIDYDKASAAVQTAHDEEVRLRGRMTNMKRIMLHSPAAHSIYAEWFTLRELLRPAIDDRAIWLLCLGIGEESNAEIPIGFFRRALISNGLQPEDIVPDENEADLIAFGQAVVRDSNAVSDELWNKLAARYDEATLVNLVAFIGIMIATAIFTNVVQVDFDAELEIYRKPAAGKAK